jgi:cell wall-associated NlpC family hydrolase
MNIMNSNLQTLAKLPRLGALAAAVLLGNFSPSQADASTPRPMSAMAAPMNAATPFLNYDGRFAAAPGFMPLPVQSAVAAANRLQGKPYIWGGGHRFLEDRGYDCSGSVSYVLFNAGLVRGPMTSKNFTTYGEPGPGRYITIYVSHDHVFISICGLRFDTSDHGAGRGDGPRWRPVSRNFSGFQVRHPAGL